MNEVHGHWDRIHSESATECVSWYQNYPANSLQFIEATAVSPVAPVIDIGCGSGRLVELLYRRGFRDLTALDVSATALQRARQRLGETADGITWIQRDIGEFNPDRNYRLWHDRAVFHFLVSETQRRRYVEVMTRGLAPGGHLVIATFAPDGPRQCSGLPVAAYDAPALCAELGERFELLDVCRERHRTPGGKEQAFAWFRFRRRLDIA